jgi:hypothetical protein
MPNCESDLRTVLGQLQKWEATKKENRSAYMARDMYLNFETVRYLFHVFRVENKCISFFGDAAYTGSPETTKNVLGELKLYPTGGGVAVEFTTDHSSCNDIFADFLGNPSQKLSSLLPNPWSSKRLHCNLLQEEKLCRIE